MKRQFLMACVFIAFFSGYCVNAMGMRSFEQATVESIDFKKVEVPEFLSYLNGKFRLVLIPQRQNFLGRCNFIKTHMQQNLTTKDRLCLLYKLLPNDIWKNECDECYILIKMEKRSAESFECAADFCVCYYDGISRYHLCTRGVNLIVRDEVYFNDIGKFIYDYVASSLCVSIGIFHMCFSKDLRLHFIDLEKKVLKPFVILECGHLVNFQRKGPWACGTCNKIFDSEHSTIGFPFSTTEGFPIKFPIGDDFFQIIYGGVVPAPVFFGE